MNRLAALLFALATASTAHADDLAKELAPTGTLRATYIATNPVQAFVDPATKEVRGPAAEIARELARRAGLPLTITGANGVQGVIDSVKNGAADIGFVAFDPVRAAQVDSRRTMRWRKTAIWCRRIPPSDRSPMRTARASASASPRAMRRLFPHPHPEERRAQAQRRRQSRRRDQAARRRRDRRLCGQPDAPARRRAEDAGLSPGAG